MGRMSKWLRWLLAIVLGAALLFAAAAVLLLRWARSDEFRVRVEQEASAALGVPLRLGALSVDLWPLPAVAADNLVLKTQPPITLERLEVRPKLLAMAQGRFQA